MQFSKRRVSAAVLTGVVALLVAAALGPLASGTGGVQLPFLYGASTGFVLTAMLLGAMQWGFGRLLLAGLAWCWMGDVAGPRHFEAGVLAFAVAHLCFSGAFLWRGICWRRLLMAVPAAALIAGGVLAWIWPHLAVGEGGLVLGYTLVISMMLALALALRPSGGNGWIQTAAIIFYVSDLFVARWRFVAPGHENALFCYPLYYTACLLFAWTVLVPAAVDA